MAIFLNQSLWSDEITGVPPCPAQVCSSDTCHTMLTPHCSTPPPLLPKICLPCPQISHRASHTPQRAFCKLSSVLPSFQASLGNVYPTRTADLSITHVASTSQVRSQADLPLTAPSGVFNCSLSSLQHSLSH